MHSVFLLTAAFGLAAFVLGGLSWGPGTHIYLADLFLKRMRRRIPPEQAEVIEAHRDTFLYGNIAADIINFKRYGGLHNHCHNWNIEERLSAFIEVEHERAFLAGYLCHLAADVIAHNYFVPFQIVYGLPPKLLGHTYWEARADGRIASRYWEIIDGLRNATELHQNDEMINKAVRRKALSLRYNKWIFNHILLARSKRSWREIMDQMRSRKPRGELHERFLMESRQASLESMYHMFDGKGRDEIRRRDPNGLQALRDARRLRRELILKHGSRSAGSEEARAAAKRKYRLP